MVRTILIILMGMAALPSDTRQTPTYAKVTPSVSILLPASLPSEKVQISYHLIGPFGGRGGYTAPQANVHSYEISTLEDGQAGTEIRMIIYAPGCEIQTFVIALAEDSSIKQEFPCEPVATVHLSGEIVPNELVRDENVELVVTYMAYWAHGFYGIVDGAVATLRLATLRPDTNGMFEVDLPYFGADAVAFSGELRASFRLMLRNSKTLNPIAANLEPNVPELRLEDGGLRIRSTYPYVLKFTGRHS